MKNKKKILMLLQSEFPPDIRLEKEIKSLSESGFEILLLCNSFNKANYNDFRGCKIIRLRSLFKSRKLNYILNFPLFLNPRLIAFVVSNSLKFKPDFIHAHDLPMVPFGILLKKILNIPLISDMHENYPAALKAYKKTDVFSKIFKNYRFAKKIEKLSFIYSDKIITVVEENKSRIINESKRADEDVLVVSNTVDLETFALQNPDNDIVKLYKENFVILYTGGVTFNRGLETPVIAMKYISERINNARMLIVGEGDSKSYLINLAKENKVDDSVEFINWPGHENLNSYLGIADLCMIPQPAIESNNTTIPHKLFEYMSKGKKLIVSDALPLKRIIDETKCGISFKSFSAEDFADKVILILNNDEISGENGRRAVENKYNWKNDSKILIEMYKNI